MRDLMTETISNQPDAQRLLHEQLRAQLEALDTQEENLLDLAVDPDIPNAKIKVRLHQIKQERERLTEQLTSVDLDLKVGAEYLEASLTLLEYPWELYQYASGDA